MPSTNNKNKAYPTHKSIQSTSNTPRTSTSECNQQAKQKRLSSTPNSPDPKKKKPLFVSTNRYAALEIDDAFDTETSKIIENMSENTQTSHEQETRISPPPPIIVRGVTDFLSVRSNLTDLVGQDNFTFKSTINSLKILPSNPSVYRAIIHYLNDNKAEFHTYQLREEKTFRVVVRNLHPTTSTAEIKAALHEIGFNVRNVVNVLHKTSKIALPLFFVDLEPDEINKEIFNINHILHTKIKIEEPYKRRNIIQCTKCQEYGHSKSYCSYPPRCVRCGAQHPSSTCQKSRDTPAKCALCNGDHPANYRGCHIHKELQKLRHPNPKGTKNQTPFSTLKTTQDNQNTPPPNSTSPTSSPTTHQRTYANATASQDPPSALSSHADTSTMLNNFLNEFKTIINPLLSLLTTVLNKLILNNDK